MRIRILTIFALVLLTFFGIHSVALAALQIGMGAQLQNEQLTDTLNINWWLNDNWALRGDYSWNTEDLGVAALYKINPGSRAALYIGLEENDLFGKAASGVPPEQKPSLAGTQLIAGMDWDLSRKRPGLSVMTEVGIDPDAFDTPSGAGNGLNPKYSITINYRFPPINETVKMNDQSTVGLLAKLIMLEAPDEPFEGQVAVAAVVLNRTHSNFFPDSVPEVIYQPGQFSTAPKIAKNVPDESAIKAANAALGGSDPSHGALYFYNPVTASSRARNYIKKAHFQVTARIGHHVFLK